MNIIDVVTKYLPAQVDKVFKADSKTAVLENGSKWIDVNFQETGYVKIANVLMDGLADYKTLNGSSDSAPDYAHYAGQNGSGARDGFHVGAAGVEWELFRLQWKRGKEFQVDYIEDEEAAGVLMANLMTEFVRVHVVPETDAVRFAEMYAKTSVALGNRATITSLSESNVIAAFNSAYEWLSENEVPSDEQVIFCSPRVMTFIRNSDKLTKFLTQTDYKSADGVTFKLEAYEGRPIIEVPSSRFLTSVLLTNNGFVPASGSNAIDFMVVSKQAIVPIRKVEYSKIFKPGEVHGFYGYIADFLFYHGVVIPKNKVPGIYAALSSSPVSGSTVAAKLLPLLQKGSSGKSIMTDYYTRPAGLYGQTVVMSNTAPDLGDIVVPGTTAGYTKITKGVEFTPDTTNSNTKFTLSLLDAYGKVIAISDEITISQVVGA